MWQSTSRIYLVSFKVSLFVFFLSFQSIPNNVRTKKQSDELFLGITGRKTHRAPSYGEQAINQGLSGTVFRQASDIRGIVLYDWRTANNCCFPYVKSDKSHDWNKTVTCRVCSNQASRHSSLRSCCLH